MVDHRRTPSQRAYQLPGWFFVLTALLSVVAFVVVGWVFLGDRSDGGSAAPQAAPAASAGPNEPEPRRTAGRAEPDTPDGEATEEPAGDEGQRSGIDVVVLNASERPGLAAAVADTAREAGWTVGDVGNWIYPAAVNAVYYPAGHEAEAEILAEDVGIDSVRPVRPGMSTDELTVLLVFAP